jgi:hypothetical protein
MRNSPYEREEQYLDDAYHNGEISLFEYRKQSAELQQDYRAAAEEASWDAYQNEMDNWQ